MMSKSVKRKDAKPAKDAKRLMQFESSLFSA